MGAGNQTDHHHQDTGEKYVVWKLQSLAVEHGVAITNNVAEKYDDWYSYAKSCGSGVEESFTDTIYKKNPDKQCEPFFKELMENYPNNKFNFVDVEVEERAKGMKADLMIEFDNGNRKPVSLKNQSTHTGAQLFASTWIALLNGVLFERAGQGIFYNPFDKNITFLGRNSAIRNDIIEKLGYPEIVSIYEWMDKVNKDMKEYYVGKKVGKDFVYREESRFHYNVADQLDKDRKSYGKKAVLLAEKALRMLPQDKVKSRMLKIAGLDCQEELLILSPKGYFCSFFNKKYQKALKRVNSEKCELKYEIREGNQGIHFTFVDDEGAIFKPFYVPFNFNINGTWWVDKKIPKYEGTRTYVGGIDNGAELQWQERKPKKSKQFATSTNTFFNYSSVC